jgi:hypothetical protein
MAASKPATTSLPLPTIVSKDSNDGLSMLGCPFTPVNEPGAINPSKTAAAAERPIDIYAVVVAFVCNEQI